MYIWFSMCVEFLLELHQVIGIGAKVIILQIFISKSLHPGISAYFHHHLIEILT